MENTEFAKLWKRYEPMVQAIVELFHPFVEAAVHDLKTGRVAAIYHNISRRRVGDPSPLKELGVEIKDFPAYFTPYYKQNWDGRPLKCTSITLQNDQGEPIGLICFNVDTSFFQDGYQLLETFLKVKTEAQHPVDLFGKDCEGHVSLMVQKFLDEKCLSIHHLNRGQKKELVQLLHQRGAFNFKNAAAFIAKKLKTTRASIYNYLKSDG